MTERIIDKELKLIPYYRNARRYIEDCISEHWSGDDDADKKVRGCYE